MIKLWKKQYLYLEGDLQMSKLPGEDDGCHEMDGSARRQLRILNSAQSHYQIAQWNLHSLTHSLAKLWARQTFVRVTGLRSGHLTTTRTECNRPVKAIAAKVINNQHWFVCLCMQTNWRINMLFPIRCFHCINWYVTPASLVPFVIWA